MEFRGKQGIKRRGKGRLNYKEECQHPAQVMAPRVYMKYAKVLGLHKVQNNDGKVTEKCTMLRLNAVKRGAGDMGFPIVNLLLKVFDLKELQRKMTITSRDILYAVDLLQNELKVSVDVNMDFFAS